MSSSFPPRPSLSEDDADAEAEVVLGRAAEAGRVVVDLYGAYVDARAEAEVEAAADDRREAGLRVVEAGDAGDARARVREADEAVGERLDLRVLVVVLDLDAADERVQVVLHADARPGEGVVEG